MKCCVLFGSPRGAESNTRALLNEFLDEWQAAGHTFVTYSLYGEAISPAWPAGAASGTGAAPTASLTTI